MNKNIKLYNNILKNVSKIVKRTINESYDDYGSNEDERYDALEAEYESDITWNSNFIFYNTNTGTIVFDTNEEGESLTEPGVYLVFEVTVKNFHIENDGIGSYEYWGQKCYDKGNDYPVIDDFDYDLYNVFELIITDDGEIDYDYELSDEIKTLDDLNKFNISFNTNIFNEFDKYVDEDAFEEIY